MLEYPSIRFKLRWGRAHKLPYRIVTAETIMSRLENCSDFSVISGTAVQDAQQQHKARSLGADRKKRSRWGGSALVHIRSPNLKGKRGNLKAKSDHHEQQTTEENLVVPI